MVNYLILPNQLFEKHPEWELGSGDTVYLYEHPVYFTKHPYHKLKLIFHRASMKNYQAYLRTTYKCSVVYVEYDAKLPASLNKSELHAYDPVDHFVQASFPKSSWGKIVWYENPAFILDTDGVHEGAKVSRTKNGNYTHASFYKWMRKRYDILMVQGGKPRGGSWSYDTENRKPFPKTERALAAVNHSVSIARDDPIMKEARRYVKRNFASNPGDVSARLYVPVTHAAAKARLRTFIRERLICFGPYEDAVHSDVMFGCHSVLSSSMNAGLLKPMDVIDAVIAYATSGGRSLSGRLLQSVEGFIRQILGWREYVRVLYVIERNNLEPSGGSGRSASSGSYFGNTWKLDRSVWYEGNGSTGVEPIDDMIAKALKYSYLHHIERLMFVGGFMLISGIHPQEVFDWFISVVSLDAYNWVMYPNIYGMSQYSCGRLMMTKPYFSSSNYIQKMSDYGSSFTGHEIWDALYYDFISRNSAKLSKNYSWAAQVKNWQRKSESDKHEIKNIVKTYRK